ELVPPSGAPAKKRQARTGNRSGNRPAHPFPKGNTLAKAHWFPKGTSGNPAGVPRSTLEMKAQAAALTDDAIRVLRDAVHGGPVSTVAVRAAQELLDRGHGNPPQPGLDTPPPASGLTAWDLGALDPDEL